MQLKPQLGDSAVQGYDLHVESELSLWERVPRRENMWAQEQALEAEVTPLLIPPVAHGEIGASCPLPLWALQAGGLSPPE